MTYKHLFIDSDVLLDMFLKREPFSDYTKLLLIECDERDLKVSTSTLIVANINYILSKKLDKIKVKENIKDITSNINVLSFERDAIDLAIDSEFIDFEDAVQHYIAQKNQCDVIISRNIKHYKRSHLPVFTAEQFLRTL